MPNKEMFLNMFH